MDWSNPTPLLAGGVVLVGAFLILLVSSYLQVRIGDYVPRLTALRWAATAAAAGALVLAGITYLLYALAY